MMKGRRAGIWIGIGLFCLLGLLVELFFKKEWIALTRGSDVAAWYGIQEWTFLESEQLHPLVLHLAASEEPRKLAFAALLGEALEAQEIEKETEKSAPFMIDRAIRSDNPEDKAKGLENTAKYLENHSNQYQKIEEKREKEGKQLIAQQTLDNWRQMALAKAAPDDVLLLNMLATFGVASNSDSAKAVREQAIIRWQQAEPDNLAPLLHQAGLNAEQLLEQAKTRHHYQEYTYPISRWMYKTLLQQLPKQQKAITMQVMAFETAAAIPNAKALIDFCKKNPPKRASQQWQRCQSIAQKLHQQSSNYIMHMVGISILHSLADSDAEKQALDNEREHLRAMLKKNSDLTMGVDIFKNHLLRLQDETINSEFQVIKVFCEKQGCL